MVIVDTAGRLHTQTNLMEELAKIRRVIAGRLEGAPHETLLVLDATTGQNGLRQAKLFGDAVEVTGVVLTKLDGTAKGGIVVAIGHELGLPVKLVGVGRASTTCSRSTPPTSRVLSSPTRTAPSEPSRELADTFAERGVWGGASSAPRFEHHMTSTKVGTEPPAKRHAAFPVETLANAHE